MEEARLRRRLAAVLAIDIAGYTRLMASDEAGTHRRAAGLITGVVETTVTQAGGRVVKKTGDGALVEFASVVDALDCAVAIQRAARDSERHVAPERRILFRMGVGIGDIIVEDDDIYGDGVNLAARLEAIADPGGIAVSDAVVHLTAQLGYAFADRGLKTLKNIARPVHVFALTLPAMDAKTEEEPPSSPRVDATVPGFGTRAAIAVLPFRHLGPEPEQAHLADGITEDLIFALARWRSFPVISRNSVFALKPDELDPATVARRLGARYVVDGSVRRTGSRLRTTVQLLDAESGRHVSAERYDCEIADLVAVQDETVRDIVGALEPELLRSEQELAVRVRPYDADAYTFCQSAVWHHYRYTKEDNRTAQSLFERALALDPDYVQAASCFAVCLVHAAQTGWAEAPDAALDRAASLARHAVRIDSRHPVAHFAMGAVQREVGLLEQSIVSYEEATRLNPSYAAAHAGLAHSYNRVNRPERALPRVELALRLSPHDPRRFLWVPALVSSHYLSGNYVRAAEVALSALSETPAVLRYLVAAYGQLGRIVEARDYLPALRRMDGDLAGTLAVLERICMVRAARDHIEAGLRAAGYDAFADDASLVGQAIGSSRGG